MDFLEDPAEVLSFVCIVLLFLLSTHGALLDYATATTDNDARLENFSTLETVRVRESRNDMATSAILNHSACIVRWLQLTWILVSGLNQDP